MKIFGPYNRPPQKKEAIRARSVTETAGYVPPHIQIEQMILSGQRLREIRDGSFDSDNDTFDDSQPLHRCDSRDFDMVDVHQVREELAAKISVANTTGKSKKSRKKNHSEDSEVPSEEGTQEQESEAIESEDSE